MSGSGIVPGYAAGIDHGYAPARILRAYNIPSAQSTTREGHAMNADKVAGVSSRPAGRWLVVIGLIVALASAAAMILPGIGYRLELWHFRTGFTIMRWAFWFAAAGAVASLLGLFVTRARPPKLLVAALIGIVIGAVTVYIPWSYKKTVDSLPYIHDITTDVQNPPAFDVVKTLRKEGEHPVEYDGPEVAAQQQKAYPDLMPLTVPAEKDKVFQAAEAAIRAMKLEVVDANAAQGRIEATATSLLFGFKDDMVVRIVSEGAGTKVDVRSKSRVGRSDLGQNAKRIRAFLAKLHENISRAG
jgi:uncharacterized protein (DUF1499 family)